MGKLDGKVAIITGAGIGIGESTAKLFAAEGAKVMVSDRDVANGQRVTQEIESSGGIANFFAADVARAKDVEAMVAATIANFGRLDILFNNAGIVGDTASTVDCTEANWDDVVDISLKGTWLGMKFGIPPMLATGGGIIINNSSTSGIAGFPNLPAYSAAKGGIVLLTKTTALEYADQGIRVNVICAGTTMTPMVRDFMQSAEGMKEYLEGKIPMGRFGEPEEVARMALFLASEDSSYCTGTVFLMDGGNLAD